MVFNWLEWLSSPFLLVFCAVAAGLLLGRIRIRNFNLGTSGSLFTGMIMGWGLVSYLQGLPPDVVARAGLDELLQGDVVPQEFFVLALIVFIASVGLLASRHMSFVLRRYGWKFLGLAVLITLSGMLASYAAAVLNPRLDILAVTGAYTGALTSSPGLAAALEASRQVALSGSGGLVASQAEAAVGAGYVIAYPFGVLLVIFFVTGFPRLFHLDVEREREILRAEMGEGRSTGDAGRRFDPAGFAVICLFGYTLGQLELEVGGLGTIGLGTTGGVLLIALLFGYTGSLGPLCFRMDERILEAIRRLALAAFLSIIGLRYGYEVFQADPYLVLTALVSGLAAVLSGFLVGRYLLKINWLILVGAICGGMTSTPGLGAAVDAVESDEPAAGYGATYPFALLGMVVFSTILPRLPL